MHADSPTPEDRPEPAPTPEVEGSRPETPPSGEGSPSEHAEGAGVPGGASEGREGREGGEHPEAAEAQRDDGGPRPKRRRRRRRKAKGATAAEGAPAEAPESAPSRRPRRRGKGPRSEAPSEHHALTAVRSLAEMTQGLLQVEGVDFLAMPRFVEVQVRVPLDAKKDGRRAANELIEQILRRVKEVRDHDRALVPGAVYSYYTDSADSSASRPSNVREVFDGYGSTGRPVFTDFVTMAIERKDPSIDALLAGEDVVLTHVTMGRVLRTAQLAEFGKDAPIYRILGQVDAGLFQLVDRDQKAAFSFQLLRGTTLEGRPRLRVHVVGAADLLDVADPSIAQILSSFQRKLDHDALRLAGSLKNGGEEALDEEEFVRPLLQDLARQLAGHARRKSRRTKHADQRAQEGRPTAKAWQDAEAAADDQLLWDDRANTVVVLGPRGRVHVFSPSAKHVTSLVMPGGAIHKRKLQGQWREAEPEERGEFRLALKTQRGAEGEDADKAEVAGPRAVEPPAPRTEPSPRALAEAEQPEPPPEPREASAPAEEPRPPAEQPVTPSVELPSADADDARREPSGENAPPGGAPAVPPAAPDASLDERGEGADGGEVDQGA